MRYLMIVLAIVLSVSMAEAGEADLCFEPSKPVPMSYEKPYEYQKRYWGFMMDVEKYQACLIKVQVELLEDIKQKLEEK